MSQRFVETTSALQVRGIIEEAIADEYPTLVMSEPGMGKTTALRHYVDEMGGFYWEVRESEGTVRQMYLSLMTAFRFWHDSRHTNDVAAALFAQLGDYTENRRNSAPYDDRPAPFLVVDEFQNLDLTALRELLRMAERARLPLVLSGNDKRLAKVKSHDTALNQVKSRIGARVTLKSPYPQDCQSIAIDYNVEGREAYEALAAYGGQTSLRDLVKLLKASGRCTQGQGSIQFRHIEQALMTLNDGDRRALKLLRHEVAA